MIAGMRFGPPSRDAEGRHVRKPVFVPRSTLPLSAACLVANGVREALTRSLASELEVELLEPGVPNAEQRRTLVDATTVVFRVRGRICDAFLILRSGDARRLVALAFAETERSECAPLSDIERATLERIVANIFPLCNTLCGTLGPAGRETAERAACDLATYFEVRTSGSPRVTIGFGLSRDPSEDVGERLTLEDLGDVILDGSVVFAAGSLAVPAFSRLAPGTTIAFDTPLQGLGILHFGNVAFARGTCGVKNGHSAIDLVGDAEARATRAA